MSDELQLFKKRLDRLERVCQRLSKEENSNDLMTITVRLSHLRNRIRSAETLNTGGHFEWVDSKIVKAFKFGQYICLEHVNLCSSAILDRLNPMFEPNGSLLLSEKGVTNANEPDVVHKHSQFRAFLTLDPKNGEISRAMRNRCIELSINQQSYGRDDMKNIIFTAGVHEMRLINCVLNIHERCRSISDFNQFGISHVAKFAMLVATNKRMGYDDEKAAFVSALEVYVRSAQIDLLGYGLAFYRNKLKAEIVDEIRLCMLMTSSEPSHGDRFRYENVILKSDQVTPLALIRRQCEPILATLRCHLQGDNSERIKSVLMDLFNGFGGISIDDAAGLIPYLFFILYESSSTADLEQRHLYLSSLLQELSCSDNGIDRLIHLNNNCFSDVSKVLNATSTEDLHRSLPWNSRIFPRLQSHYKSGELPLSTQLRLSALMLSRVVLEQLQVQSATKLSQIDAISYSKALHTKQIQDTVNNDLLRNLYPFLDGIRGNIDRLLSSDCRMDLEHYLHLICSYLWYNRLLKMAQRQLLVNKSTVNDTVVDTLTLHFKWMDKYFMRSLSSVAHAHTMDKFHKKLTNYILTNHHPLNLTRKIFVKTLTNSLPYYELQQVDTHEMCRLFSAHTRLVPQYGGAFASNKLRQRWHAVMKSSNVDLKISLSKQIETVPSVEWLKKLKNCTTDSSQTIDDKFGDLAESLNIFFDKITALTPDDSSRTSNVDLEAEFNRFETEYKEMDADETISTDDPIMKLLIEMLPLLEYYALRSTNHLITENDSHRLLNGAFFDRIQSIRIGDLQLLRRNDSPAYQVGAYLWKKLIPHVQSDRFTDLLSHLPADFYKSWSSFERNWRRQYQEFALNSVAVTSAICYQTPPAMNGVGGTTNGSILTRLMLMSLFERSGELKASGLGDLDGWRISLRKMAQLVWSNVELQRNEFSFE